MTFPAGFPSSEAIVVYCCLLLFTPELIRKKKVGDKQHNGAKAMTLIFFVHGLGLVCCVMVCCAFKRTI
jgi:hypothetical protein